MSKILEKVLYFRVISFLNQQNFFNIIANAALGKITPQAMLVL